MEALLEGIFANTVLRQGRVVVPQEVALYGKPVSREIVGVVGNVKHEELSAEFQPEMYLPAYQLPPNGMTLVVRGRVPAETLTDGMRRAVRARSAGRHDRRRAATDRHAAAGCMGGHGSVEGDGPRA